MQVKDLLRVDVETGKPTDQGRLFLDVGRTGFSDLSKVRLLRCGVDTVRQLYRGLIQPHVLAIFEKTGTIVEFAGQRWHAGRVGRDSGYQFKLQNADLGFVLLIKNFNAKADSIGPHLKIEVSPHAIDSLSPERLQARLDFYASEVLTCIEVNQCAVHLALDVQGWQPPADLVARMHCRARNHRDVSGIQSIEWAMKSSVYGRGETSMFGSANGIQLCIYNKTEQAKATDKLDFWESIWRRGDDPFDSESAANYQPDQDVWRIEMRYHHSIIQQFASGSVDLKTGAAIDTRTYAAFCAHLDGLWRYGLQSFKLLARPGYYDAFWTVLREEVVVDLPVDSLVDETEYKRYYKTAHGFSGKNVELFLGNFVSLLARERVGATRAFECLKEWDCWPVIRDHYAAKDITERGIYKHIRDLLEERHVRWGRAV